MSGLDAREAPLATSTRWWQAIGHAKQITQRIPTVTGRAAHPVEQWRNGVGKRRRVRAELMAKRLGDDRWNLPADRDRPHQPPRECECVGRDILGSSRRGARDDDIPVERPKRSSFGVIQNPVIERAKRGKCSCSRTVRGVHTLADLESPIGSTHDKCHSGQITTRHADGESETIAR